MLPESALTCISLNDAVNFLCRTYGDDSRTVFMGNIKLTEQRL